MRLQWAIAILCVPAVASADVGPWATYRGNGQRTGNTDGLPGPASPQVLWFVKTNEQFATSSVPCEGGILFPALGAFNSGYISSYPTNPKDPKANAPTWTKGQPLLKLPTVSSPAVAAGTLVFGDGMHQTDGATLYCFPSDGGRIRWALPVPGKLVHLEGAPTVHASRVYIGGGSAGVLCVDLGAVMVNDKAVPPAEAVKLQEADWKARLEKYEADKKKDPDFAIMPTEADVLKPVPKVHWQVGKDRWHVDAPVLVAGGTVLVASAYLDVEKLGDRALYCLEAATGKELWRAPLTLNPWGGPTLVGDTVVVTTSSISYDPKQLAGAKGEVIAFDWQTGKERWKKSIPGGVLGCASATKDAVVFCATDGKVRSFAVADGSRKMIYDAKAGLFASPAVVGDVAYVADLNGVVHAINLATGAAAWTLDLAKDPVKLPGMVYGGITVHGGKLYLGTCNLEGPFARQPTAVVCIGGK